MSEWIRVEDRLPDELTLVLAYRGGYNLAIRVKDNDWRWLEGHMGWDLETPTYWMPLPSKPTEEE